MSNATMKLPQSIPVPKSQAQWTTEHSARLDLLTRVVSPTKTDIAVATVHRIATYVAQGNETMAQEERRTLNTLIAGDYGGGYGYPPRVVAALKAAGLRSTVR